MLIIRMAVIVLAIMFAALVVWNLPYPYLSPRWFFTAIGIAFVTAAFIGFVSPAPPDDKPD